MPGVLPAKPRYVAACVRGTRIPVHQVFRMLANGDSVDSLLRAYPSLQRGDILACFDYAACSAKHGFGKTAGEKAAVLLIRAAASRPGRRGNQRSPESRCRPCPSPAPTRKP